MSFHQRDEIRWNKKGYFERFDGKKYWRKLCVIDGCMKRAKVVSWCKRHYTEQKQKNALGPTSLSNSTTSSSSIRSVPVVNPTSNTNILSSNLLFSPSHYSHLQGISQIPMPPPAYLITSISSSTTASPLSSQAILHLPNEIRLNKRGYREQYDGSGRWRPLCIWQDCSKKAKKLSYCKRHYTEQVNQRHANMNSIQESVAEQN